MPQKHRKLADPRGEPPEMFYERLQQNHKHFGKEMRRRRRRGYLAKLSRRANRRGK